MKTVLAAAAIFVASVFGFAEVVSPPEEDKAPLPAAVLLNFGQRVVCSGVHIGDGFVLTAAHCAESGQAPKLDGNEVELLWSNSFYDVALLRLDDASGRDSASLDCRTPAIGEKVYAVTSPRGIEAVHSYGRVAGTVRKLSRWREVVPVNIMAAPGSSGGPLFDSQGSVVGIVTAIVKANGGFSLVVPASTVCGLMARG